MTPTNTQPKKRAGQRAGSWKNWSLTNLCRSAVLAAGLVGMGAGSVAKAQPQTDLVDQTGWWWMANVDATTVSNKINEGFRLVDIEIEDDNPLRMSAAFVRNSGNYQKGWWWYYNATAADVSQLLSDNGARLIDLEPYNTAAGLRFAVVMIQNKGEDASGHGWYYGRTFQQMSDYVNNNPNWRILDIQPYQTAFGTRYAYVVKANSGREATAWWYYANVSGAFISQKLGENKARLIDLEENGNGNYSCVMLPRDGNAWWWLYNVDFTTARDFADQYGARITDIQRWNTASGSRYAVIYRQNENNLALRVNGAMRGITDGSSGFSLTELGGSEWASIQESKGFEPASLMKTLHHVAMMKQIQQGNEQLNSLIVVDEGLSGSCPNGSSPQAQSMQQALTDMMVSSSNADTEAIRQRLGFALPVTQIGLGMTDTELNHTIGCFCNSQRNVLTLDDLTSLYQGVHNGYLGSFEDEFYDIMINSLNSNVGGGMTMNSVLSVELAASDLTLDQQNEFRSSVYLAQKGGSYTCNGGLNNGQFRSNGGMFRVPFRTGCRDRIREFAYGAWVNDATNGADASTAVGTASTELFREVVRDAITSWEASACGCPADFNGDGFLDSGDIQSFVDAFLSQSSTADFNGDGFVETGDISSFVDAFLAGC